MHLLIWGQHYMPDRKCSLFAVPAVVLPLPALHSLPRYLLYARLSLYELLAD